MSTRRSKREKWGARLNVTPRGLGGWFSVQGRGVTRAYRVTGRWGIYGTVGLDVRGGTPEDSYGGVILRAAGVSGSGLGLLN